MRSRSLPFALLALVALTIAGALTPLLARDAEAHASLVRANPSNNETLRRAPTRVTLNFSEPLERKLTEIQVLDQDGNRVDEGGTRFDDANPLLASVGLQPLDPGLYIVRWRNVSTVDGHGLSGQYPFVVLNPDGTFPAGVSLEDAASSTSGGDLLPKPFDSLLKWIQLVSLAIVGGAAFFLFAVIRPAGRFLEEETYNNVTDTGERWVVNLAHILLPAAFISTAILVLITWNRFPTDTSLWTYLTSVRPGQWRLAGLILVLVALAGADLLYLARSERQRVAGMLVLIAASAAAMFTYSMVSHGATGAGRFWSIASDVVHFVASATWIGALVLLVPTILWTRRHMDEQPRFLYLANAFDRFSVIAGVSVAAVLATGLFNALAQVPSWDALTDTTYGRVLLAKLAIVAPLLAIAAINAYVLKPRLVAAIDGLYQSGGDGTPDQRRTWSDALSFLQRWLPRTVVVEVVLVVAVFAAVGVLTQTTTAEGEIAADEAASGAGQDFEQAAAVDSLNVTLRVSPNRVGLNEYELSVTDESGRPVETVTQARLRFTYEDVADLIPQSEIILNELAPGEFTGGGAYFTQPGNWRVEAGIRRSDGDDLAQDFVLPVLRPETQPGAGDESMFDLPFTSFTWNEVAGAFLVLGGVLVLLYRKQLRWLETPAYRAAITVAVVVLVAGGVLAFAGGDEHEASEDPRSGNPELPTQQSIARGRELFQQNCIQCHGVDGRGDGPQAASLNPQPTDFRLHIPLHTDPQFYAFIADGYPGSAMPAFRDALSEDDIWNLVNFLRSEFSEPPSQ